MLNPLLLWFLPLALVPVLLHLITRRRLQTRELSTFRFLMDSHLQQRRRLRFIEWLVMALRVSFILLIVFVLARPVVQGMGLLSPREGGRDVTLILDASPTMHLRSDTVASHRRAVTAAGQLLDRLADDDHVRLIRAGPTPNVLAQGFAGRRAPLDRALESFEPAARTPDLAGALDLALDTSARGMRSIYIITDAMARTWRPAAGRSRALPDTTLHQPVTVLDVGPEPVPDNLAVVGEPPRTPRAVRGLPLLLDATVVNQGHQTRETTLSLVLGEQRFAEVNLRLAPGERRTHRFNVRPPEAGFIEGRFEVPASAFPPDDVYRFALNVKPHIDLYIIADPEAAASRPARERAALYLEAALAAGPEDTEAIDAQTTRRLAQAVRTEVIEPDDLLRREETLADADVMLLTDVALDERRMTRLRRWVEQGGGLMILPGPATDPDSCTRHLLTSRRATTPSLRLGEPVGELDDVAGAQRIERIDQTHPILSVFDEPRYFSSVRVFRRFPIEVNAQANPTEEQTGGTPPARVLLETEDGTPLLAETALGRGRVLVMGVPAAPGWSDLPLKPEFVPLLLRAALHIQRPAEAIAPAVVQPGQTAQLQITGRWPRAQATARGPQGDEHTLDLHRSGHQRIGALHRTHQPGFYRFSIWPRHDAAPRRAETGFAVNPEPDQVALARADEADLRAALAPAEFVALRGEPDDPMLARHLNTRREIWRTLIWLTLLVIGLEFLLATLQPRPTPQQQSAVATTRWHRWTRTLRTTLNPLHAREEPGRA